MSILYWVFVAVVVGILGVGVGFKIALYALPLSLAVFAVNTLIVELLKRGRSYAQRPGAYLVELVAGVATWVLTVWAWVDGVFLALDQGPDTPLNPAWIRSQVQPGSAFGTHLLRDFWWAVHAAVLWPLKVWHRSPLLHLGPLWQAQTLWRITLLWLEYDVVAVALAFALMGAWWALAHVEAWWWGRWRTWLGRPEPAPVSQAPPLPPVPGLIVFRQRRAAMERRKQEGRQR